MSDSFLFCVYSSIFSRMNDLSKNVFFFFQSRSLENTEVSRHSADVLHVLVFFLCVPINLFSSELFFWDMSLAEVSVPLNIMQLCLDLDWLMCFLTLSAVCHGDECVLTEVGHILTHWSFISKWHSVIFHNKVKTKRPEFDVFMCVCVCVTERVYYMTALNIWLLVTWYSLFIAFR